MTYDQLKTDMADWLMREDLEPQIPSFIRFAEAEFNRRLRIQDMVVRADAKLENSRLGLPGDFLQTRSIYLPERNPLVRLEFVPLDVYTEEVRRQRSSTNPMYYTVTGDEIAVVPKPESDELIELVYYARLPALSEDRQSNWLLAKHPDLYLYAALVHSAPFLNEDERINTWQGLKEQGINTLKLESERGEFSGPLRTRTRAL